MLKRKISVTFAVIAMILLVQACRKLDFFSKESKTPEFTVAEAKEWYYGVFIKSAGYKQVDLSSPFAPDPDYLLSSNTRTNSTFFKKYPYWNKAIHYSSGNIQVVEMPVAYEANILVLPGMQKLSAEDRKKVAASSLQKILFIKNADQSVSVRMVTLIPSLAYLKSKDFDISDNTMQNPDKNFDGVVVIRNWQEKIINVIEVKDAKYTRKIKLVKSAVQPTNPNNTSDNIALRSTDGCGWVLTVRTVRYCISTTGSSGDQPPADPECPSGDWSEYQEEEWEYMPCEGDEEDPFQQCIEMGNSNEQCSCDIYGLGCGGEGDQPPGDDGTPQQDNEVVDQIEVELTDSCLQKAVDQINTATALGTEIGSILHETFTFWDAKDLFIKQRCFSDTSTDAQTLAASTIIVVTFNECALNNASQEYIAATLYHEILHAYFDAHGRTTELNQHIDMANHYVNAMKNTLMENFPGLTNADAEALAWGGLQDTDAWDNLVLTDPNRALDISWLNNRHKQGDWGTKCRLI